MKLRIIPSMSASYGCPCCNLHGAQRGGDKREAKRMGNYARRGNDKREIAAALADMASGVILAKSCDDEPGDTFGDFAFQNYMDDMSDYFDECRYQDYLEQDLADTLL